MNVLVTGGAGFIGSHLSNFLITKGANVTIIDTLSNSTGDLIPSSAKFINGDIRDVSLVKGLIAKSDACVHLAAISSLADCDSDPYSAAEINVMGTIDIFNAVIQSDKKPIVIYASSAAVYGSQSQPSSETTKCNPDGIYGLSKHQCEQWAKCLSDKGLSAIGLRFFNVYGYPFNNAKNQSDVVSGFIKKAIKHEDLIINGCGNQVRDFIDVNDVVQSIAQLISINNPPSVMNLCTGNGTSVNDLAAIIQRLFDADANIIHQPSQSWDLPYSIGDTKRMQKILPNVKPISITQGLQRIKDII